MCKLPFTTQPKDSNSNRTMQPIDDTLRMSIFIKLPIDIQELLLESAYLYRYKISPKTPITLTSTLNQHANQHAYKLSQWLINLMHLYLINVDITFTDTKSSEMTTISILMYNNQDISTTKRVR